MITESNSMEGVVQREVASKRGWHGMPPICNGESLLACKNGKSRWFCRILAIFYYGQPARRVLQLIIENQITFKTCLKKNDTIGGFDIFDRVLTQLEILRRSCPT